MPRPIWKGAVPFGLVTIPVGLYSATERQAEIAFRQLHKKDHVPIEYKRVCSAEGVEVAWQDIEKGYEYAKGQFVVVTDEDLAKAKVAGTQTIEIREFVPAEQIDFAHFEAPYWLAPEKAGTKAYALLRDALAKSGRVGIATFVMREREHLAALRPEGRGIMLTTMRFADEIRSADDLALPAEGEHPKKEMDLALQLVDALADDWDPTEYPRHLPRDSARCDRAEGRGEGDRRRPRFQHRPRSRISWRRFAPALRGRTNLRRRRHARPFPRGPRHPVGGEQVAGG